MRFLLALLAASSIWIVGCTNGPVVDIGASTNALCCGANCCCASIGSGGAISAGDLNPDNMCERCDPATNPRAWTPIPGCMAGSDAGADTDAGSDAGSTDTDAGGMTVADAGSVDTDAGPTTGTDAGPTTGTDAGPSTGTDAGSSSGTDAGPPADDGGGCSVSPSAPASQGPLALLGLLAAGLVFRRRRN